MVKSSSVRWAGNVTSIEVRSGVWEVLMRKRKRKTPFGRFSFKWDFNIKTDVTEICRRAWTALIWISDNAILEIHLTYIRNVLSDLELVRNDYG
jgi:hypothetical protein